MSHATHINISDSAQLVSGQPTSEPASEEAPLDHIDPHQLDASASVRVSHANGQALRTSTSVRCEARMAGAGLKQSLVD